MNSKEIVRKLRISKDDRMLILNASEEYLIALDGFSYHVSPAIGSEGKYDFVQVFATSNEELARLAKSILSFCKFDCLFWACYPKGSGKIKSDLKRESVWEILARFDLQCVSQVAIDETWSALRARPVSMVGK